MIGPISYFMINRRVIALEIFFISAGRVKKTDVYLDVQFAGGNTQSITNIITVTTTLFPCPDIVDEESCRQVDDVSIMRRIYASGVRATNAFGSLS